MPAPVCELCTQPGGHPLWEDALCRVIRVEDPHYTAFCRVVWKAHVAEMTDLTLAQRQHLMQVVYAVEYALRQLVQPDKINLASFGNMVPHLHWHVIPRWRDDRHFPQPVWGEAQRPGAPRALPDDSKLHHAITAALAAEQGGQG